MKRFHILPALLLATACAVPAPEPAATREGAAPAVQGAAPASVAEGNAAFGVALYKKLSEEPGNIFLSPISIAGAFGPAVAGAEAETRSAIASTLRFPAGGGAGLHPGLGGLLRNLEREREGATLSIANALWVMQGFALKPDFTRIVRQDYAATIEPLDFARAPRPAADRINGWVSEETRGRIKELIAADSLNQDTALVITNAVYLLADWPTPFNASNTRDQPFYTPGGPRQQPLMYRKAPFRYFETDAFQAIDLPYKDERLSMTVFLPKARDGLAAFEARLNEPSLREWLARIDAEQPRTVYLHLPKLRIEQSYNLVPALGAMGMGVAFDPRRANFRGIAERDLFISQVVHKTFVRIDEKGTEAAAATGIEVQVTSAPIVKPPTFRADHPFFFLLREKESGAVLFLGRIVAPERP